MAPAHDSVRGSKKTHSDLCKRAKTKQERASLSGDEEQILQALNAAGLRPIPLYAVDKFNIDFAFPDVLLAIEYHGGNWHNSSKKRAQDARKAEFLEALEWTMLVFPRLAAEGEDPNRIDVVTEVEIVDRVQHELLRLRQSGNNGAER